MGIFYVALYLFYRDPGKGFSGLPSKVGNSPVRKSLTYLPGVISLGKHAWFCSSNFKNFNSLGPKAKKNAHGFLGDPVIWGWQPSAGTACSSELYVNCPFWYILKVERIHTSKILEQSHFCRTTTDARMLINHKQDFFIISDEKLQTFEICRGTTFFQRREKMEEKYSLLSEHVGGQMIEFSQHTPTSTMSPSVDHHQMLLLQGEATWERKACEQTDHLP